MALNTGLIVVANEVALPEAVIRYVSPVDPDDTQPHQRMFLWDDIRTTIMTRLMDVKGQSCKDDAIRRFFRCTHEHCFHIHVRATHEDSAPLTRGNIARCELYVCWRWLRTFLRWFIDHVLRRCRDCGAEETRVNYARALAIALHDLDTTDLDTGCYNPIPHQDDDDDDEGAEDEDDDEDEDGDDEDKAPPPRRRVEQHRAIKRPAGRAALGEKLGKRQRALSTDDE